MFVDEGILNGLDLGRDDGEHRYVDSVELVKTAPGSTLTETRKQFPNSLCTQKPKFFIIFCLEPYFSHV